MSSVIEHCDAQCDKCAIGCLSAVAVAATDETAEWAARSANSLRSSSMGLLPRESLPLPTYPFAPDTIERHERRKSTRLLLTILGASACLVMWGGWAWLR